MVLYDPKPEQVIASAARRGLILSEPEAALLIELGRGTFDGCARVASDPAENLPVRYPRSGGRRPSPEENSLNAWAWRCDIQGADDGVLAGRTVVLKDIVPVAGQPMSAGSAILEGHVPSFDATVTSRILDQGGRIIGIAATEDMCLSGASVSAVTGYVRNPRDASRSAGGSSSGVAALIGSGAADVGIGADQGGSIRIPSSLSGIFGMKPTYGLIPYTGCASIDPSLDHLGPMAGTVEDLARLLQAVAGFDDGLDPVPTWATSTIWPTSLTHTSRDFGLACYGKASITRGCPNHRSMKLFGQVQKPWFNSGRRCKRLMFRCTGGQWIFMDHCCCRERLNT